MGRRWRRETYPTQMENVQPVLARIWAEAGLGLGE